MAKPLLGVLAAALAAAVLWAATALAAGDAASSSGRAEGDDSPAAVLTQEDGNAPAVEDCPQRDGGADGADDASADL